MILYINHDTMPTARGTSPTHAFFPTHAFSRRLLVVFIGLPNHRLSMKTMILYIYHDTIYIPWYYI